MTQDMRDVVPGPCRLFALGEPTHGEPAFARVRNTVFAALADQGFRAIALETDRVAALTVDAYVRHGTGTLDTAMRTGFSHGFGHLDANRDLVAWMRAHNENRPPEHRLAFHGFDTPVEMTRAPSPRGYLEHAADYLGVDLDIAGLAGADERWSRQAAVLDPAASPGATEDADRLSRHADDLRTMLYARAPELVAATSRGAWRRARVHLDAGIGLLRYHRRSARPDDGRLAGILATRDALMAQNLLDIGAAADRRGPTLVFAHNRHLQRTESHWRLAGTDLRWFGAGAVAGALLGGQYTVVAGSLGRSAALGLAEPGPDTYEGALGHRIPTWGVTRAVPAARTRTDTTPEQGYFPLDSTTLGGVDAVLHIADGALA